MGVNAERKSPLFCFLCCIGCYIECMNEKELFMNRFLDRFLKQRNGCKKPRNQKVFPASRGLFLIILLIFFGSIPLYSEGPCDREPSMWLVSGIWEGRLSVGSASLRLVFTISINGDGRLAATMDSPDQGVKGIPVASISFDGEKLILNVEAVAGSYEGRLNAAAGSMEGFWKQGGSSFPLALTLKEGSRNEGAEAAARGDEASAQGAEAAAHGVETEAPAAADAGAETRGATVQSFDAPVAARPQEPKPPFPYISRDLNLLAGDGVKLAGTLVLPEGEGPFPAALLVSGSGAQDRDETLFGHKPFWIIADYLARRGIATLRLDDRGFGESQGNFAISTTLDFEADALSALEYLKTYPGLDPGKIGIIGHSEGGIIAAMTASKVPDLAFAVLLAGPGVSGEDLLYQQQAALAKAYGMSPEAIQNARFINQSLYQVAKRPEKAENLKEELISVYLSFLPEGADESLKAKAGQEAALVAEQLLSPWMRTFLVLDPQPYLREIAIPVLAMNGTKDLQVPSGENLESIRQALIDAGNSQYSIAELPGLNHLFQKAQTGLPDEYAQIEESFSEDALKCMGDWLVEVLSL